MGYAKKESKVSNYLGPRPSPLFLLARLPLGIKLTRGGSSVLALALALALLHLDRRDRRNDRFRIRLLGTDIKLALRLPSLRSSW